VDKEALEAAHQGSELVLAVGAFLGIIITQIVTTKLNSMKIEALAKQVAKQNGKLGRTSHRLIRMQIRCAGMHGIELPLDEIVDDDDDKEEG